MTNHNKTAPVIVRGTPLASGPGDDLTLLRVLPAWIISAVIHAIMIGGFVVFMLLIPGLRGDTGDNLENVALNTNVEEESTPLDLTNPDIGIDPTVPLNYNVPRIEQFSVPGQVVPSENIGIENAPSGPPTNVSPPPGMGFGQGGGVDSKLFGTAPSMGFTGGANGFKLIPGGFGGRSGSTRQQIALQGGGSKESEAAVARALEWIAKHQARDGSWSLDRFHQHAHDLGTVKYYTCDCKGQGQHNDIAATAFGLLPFLAAGQTHRPSGDRGGLRDYSKSVENGLKFLMAKQGKDGNFGGGMYAHGLATIAMCEAFGMTSDPLLKQSAQKALDFIIYAQHEPSGGWRYAPKQSGDTSVVGWQVMALKSGQMAGLAVPTPTLKGAEKWLDSVMDKNTYGYGYTSPQARPTTTAVGLLCRQYLGWSPRKHELITGVEYLAKQPPTPQLSDMYYYYYATQVMHHMGGELWEAWNPKMRDFLIKAQCTEGTGHRYGSWDPEGDHWCRAGGRLMKTSLSVLTLEVYYRHLPLYRRDIGGNKELDN
jgi:hypothetical protein